MSLTLTLSSMDSPIGPLALASDADGRLRGVSFADGLTAAMRKQYPAAVFVEGGTPDGTAQALQSYFAGDREALRRVDWSLDGAAAGDGFQARVWRALADVPVGRTITYGEMARRAGDPEAGAAAGASAAQAAGVALNRNPIALVLPCHRVIGADGAMVGFGGGLERKTWLLRHEGALLI